jgi:hypothetical protein
MIKQIIVVIEVYHFSSMYKILSSILLRMLNPYAEVVIEDHQCRYRYNRKTIDNILR